MTEPVVQKVKLRRTAGLLAAIAVAAPLVHLISSTAWSGETYATCRAKLINEVSRYCREQQSRNGPSRRESYAAYQQCRKRTFNERVCGCLTLAGLQAHNYRSDVPHCFAASPYRRSLGGEEAPMDRASAEFRQIRDLERQLESSGRREDMLTNELRRDLQRLRKLKKDMERIHGEGVGSMRFNKWASKVQVDLLRKAIDAPNQWDVLKLHIEFREGLGILFDDTKVDDKRRLIERHERIEKHMQDTFRLHQLETRKQDELERQLIRLRNRGHPDLQNRNLDNGTGFPSN